MYEVTTEFNPKAYPVPRPLEATYKWSKSSRGVWSLYSRISGRHFSTQAALCLLGYV